MADTFYFTPVGTADTVAAANPDWYLMFRTWGQSLGDTGPGTTGHQQTYAQHQQPPRTVAAELDAELQRRYTAHIRQIFNQQDQFYAAVQNIRRVDPVTRERRPSWLVINHDGSPRAWRYYDSPASDDLLLVSRPGVGSDEPVVVDTSVWYTVLPQGDHALDRPLTCTGACPLTGAEAARLDPDTDPQAPLEVDVPQTGYVITPAGDVYAFNDRALGRSVTLSRLLRAVTGFWERGYEHITIDYISRARVWDGLIYHGWTLLSQHDAARLYRGPVSRR